MTTDLPAPDSHLPEDEESIFEPTDSEEGLPEMESAEVLPPKPVVNANESGFRKLIFPGIEAGMWMLGAMIANLAGNIAGGASYLLYAWIVDGETNVSMFNPPKEMTLSMAIGGQIAMLLFASVGVVLRLGPRISDRLGLRKISLGHFFIVIGLIWPVQCLAQLVATWADGLFKRMGIPDSAEMYSQAIQDLLSAGSMPVMILIIAVGPALGEELVFRGLIGNTLVRRWGVWAGVLATSLLFGLMHLIPIQVVAVIPIGLVMHLVYLATKSFWAPVLLHFCNNSMALVFAHLSGALAEGEANLVDTDLPAGLVITASITVACLLTVLWKTRRQFLHADGTAWDPGYVTVEAPPGITPSELASRPADRITYIAASLALISFAILVYLSL